METDPTKNLNPNKEINEAVDYIGEIISQLGLMGNNDYELPTLVRLREEVKSGQRPPNEAKSIAFTMLDRKQQGSLG